MYLYNGISSIINPFYITPKGFELKAKLNELKNYLNDFTNIKDESIDKIKLYDE